MALAISVQYFVNSRAGLRVKRRYFNFCKLVGKKPIPTTECTLTLFVTHLATSNTSLRTIKVYLAAVRHMHVCKGLHKQFNYQVTPRLQLILRGIKKRKAGRHFTNHACQSPFPFYAASKLHCQKKPPLTTALHSELCAALPSSAS